MKYKIIENESKKTVSVLINNTRFYSAKYLLERWESNDGKKRYFGQAVLPFDKTEFGNFTKLVAHSLSKVRGFRVVPENFVENELIKYPVFRCRYDKDGNWTGEYEVALSIPSDNKQRDLFTLDLNGKYPVTDEQEVKNHEWAIELELYASFDEDSLEIKVGSILHRIIRGKEVSAFSKNDELWTGFNFEEPEDYGLEETRPDAVIEEYEITDDDIPF